MLKETLTALEKSKHELSDALKAEKDLGELKSRFVSMASHEFKTPLSTILSSAYLLDKYNDLEEPAKRSKHITRIKNAVNDMKLILDDFLSLDKLDEGLIKVDVISINAENIFREIEAIISEMQVNSKPGQTIEFTHTGNNDVLIDERLLKNICVNLLSNAIKFSPENSIIKIACIISENDFILSIKDNGIGISEEDKQHLFERFFRAKNAFNIQGTGLGLHIVGKYLELMNGTIEIESGLNKGSVFTIHIPQA
jgi:signal transduction histidine kinase